MKSKTLLRIAAVLILVHLLGHTMGHLGWDKPEDPKMLEVVNTMKGYSSEFMGATKSMADYYNGYSLLMFVVLGMSFVVIWSVSTVIEKLGPIGALLYPFGIGFILFGVIEFIYFFPFAAIISFLAGLAILIAGVRAKSS